MSLCYKCLLPAKMRYCAKKKKKENCNTNDFRSKTRQSLDRCSQIESSPLSRYIFKHPRAPNFWPVAYFFSYLHEIVLHRFFRRDPKESVTQAAPRRENTSESLMSDLLSDGSNRTSKLTPRRAIPYAGRTCIVFFR